MPGEARDPSEGDNTLTLVERRQFMSFYNLGMPRATLWLPLPVSQVNWGNEADPAGGQPQHPGTDLFGFQCMAVRRILSREAGENTFVNSYNLNSSFRPRWKREENHRLRRSTPSFISAGNLFSVSGWYLLQQQGEDLLRGTAHRVFFLGRSPPECLPGNLSTFKPHRTIWWGRARTSVIRGWSLLYSYLDIM